MVVLFEREKLMNMAGSIYEWIKDTNRPFAVYMKYRYPNSNHTYEMFNVDPSVTEYDLNVKELDLYGWYKKYWGIIVGD